MKRFFLSVLLLFSSLAASAVTLEPLPGTTLQFTTAGAFVPEPIGVVVRGEGGVPLAGVSVTFSVVFLPPETGTGFFPGFGTTVTVVSDEFGIAMPEPTVVGEAPGSFTVVASSPAGSNEVSFLITVEAHELAVSEIDVLSNDLQAITVQALDATGAPVPFAAIEFSAPPTGASGTFDGSRTVIVTADASGIAVAPSFLANAIEGQGVIIVAALGTEVFAEIRFNNKKAGPGGPCKHDSKGGHKHDGKHPGKDC